MSRVVHRKKHLLTTFLHDCLSKKQISLSLLQLQSYNLRRNCATRPHNNPPWQPELLQLLTHVSKDSDSTDGNCRRKKEEIQVTRRRKKCMG